MKEQSNTIVTVPNPLLYEVSKPIAFFDDKLKEQIQTMVKILRQADGVGLAAPQLGYKNSVFVVEFIDKSGKNNIPLQIFINPQIVKYSPEEIEMNEGCLSVPQIELPVIRPEKVKIKAQDQNGKKFRLTAKGLLARIIQHENDHLIGRVFTQKVKDKLFSEYPELKKLKIIFIGTGAFAEQILRGLILLGLNIDTVITEQGKPSGSDQKICHSIVAQTANIFKKNLLETINIKDDIDEIGKINPDLIILTDFGQILPQDILNIPKICAVNLHPSLLPKYRGATPIASAILDGVKETGVSMIKMSSKIDQGELLAQIPIEISEDDNALSLQHLLANVSLKMLIDILPKLQNKEIKTIKQDDTEASYTHKFKKEDGEINWKKSVKQIERQIRAFFPWPGSYTFINDKRLIIHQAHLDNRKLVLDIVQPEGKNIMLWQDFLRGYKGKKTDWFKKIK